MISHADRRHASGGCLCGRIGGHWSSKAWLRCISPIMPDKSSRIAGNGGRCFEAVQLCRSIHLGHMVSRYCRLGPAISIMPRADWSAVTHGAPLFFVKSKRVYVTPVSGLRCGSKVEDPDNLIVRQSDSSPKEASSTYEDHG